MLVISVSLSVVNTQSATERFTRANNTCVGCMKIILLISKNVKVKLLITQMKVSQNVCPININAPMLSQLIRCIM